LLDEQACSEDNSAIRPRADWQKNIQEGAQHFVNKHRYTPVQVPNISQEDILARLKLINKHYSKA